MHATRACGRKFWQAVATALVLSLGPVAEGSTVAHSALGCEDCHAPTRQANTWPAWQAKGGPSAVAWGPLGSRSGSHDSSSICLACHDGTVGSLQLGASADTERHAFAGLGNHPVGVAYDARLIVRDERLNDPLTTPSGLGGTIAEDLLEDGRVECTSCHAPHFDGATAGGLIRDNDGSALCLVCHRR